MNVIAINPAAAANEGPIGIQPPGQTMHILQRAIGDMNKRMERLLDMALDLAALAINQVTRLVPTDNDIIDDAFIKAAGENEK